MKYTPKQYAAAFLAALEGKSKIEREKIVRRLVENVARRGDSPRLGMIVGAIEEAHLKKEGVSKIEVEAPEALSAQVRKEIEGVLGKKTLLKEKINPAALAGLRILVNDEILIDATAETQIKKLFAQS